MPFDELPSIRPPPPPPPPPMRHRGGIGTTQGERCLEPPFVVSSDRSRPDAASGDLSSHMADCDFRCKTRGLQLARWPLRALTTPFRLL